MGCGQDSTQGRRPRLRYAASLLGGVGWQHLQGGSAGCWRNTDGQAHSTAPLVHYPRAVLGCWGKMWLSEGTATLKLGNLGAGMFGLVWFWSTLSPFAVCKTGVLLISGAVVRFNRNTQLGTQDLTIYACLSEVNKSERGWGQVGKSIQEEGTAASTATDPKRAWRIQEGGGAGQGGWWPWGPAKKLGLFNNKIKWKSLHLLRVCS